MSLEQRDRNIRRRGSTNIPPEIVEKILLNLSIKSLFRFCVVSKSWRSMIVESGFAKRYRSGAALHHRERIFISSGILTTRRCRTYFSGVRSCHPSAISSDVLIEDIATPIVCPIPGEKPSLLAYCDEELWCVEVDGSLYLWNPFINSYRKIPNPVGGRPVHRYFYGLGYDSVNDDYKIIANRGYNEHQLYSLRSDSWRKIDPPWQQIGSVKSALLSVFVSGAFHWLTKPHAGGIISFDLSKETFGEVAPPSIPEEGISRHYAMKLIVLRGKLCVCLNDIRNSRFVMWVMEEYEVEKSWSKRCDIYWSRETLPYAPSKPCGTPRGRIKEYAPLMHPFYVYENGEILFRVFRGGMNAQVLLYKGKDEEKPWRIVSREISHIAFVCAQGIFSPASQLVNNK